MEPSRGGRQAVPFKLLSGKSGSRTSGDFAKSTKHDRAGATGAAKNAGGSSGISFALKRTRAALPVSTVRLGNQRPNPLNQASSSQSASGKGLFGIESYLSESDAEEEAQPVSSALAQPSNVVTVSSSVVLLGRSATTAPDPQHVALPADKPSAADASRERSAERDSYLVAEAMLYGTALPPPRTSVAAVKVEVPPVMLGKESAEIRAVRKDAPIRIKIEKVFRRHDDQREERKSPPRRSVSTTAVGTNLDRKPSPHGDRRKSKTSSDMLRSETSSPVFFDKKERRHSKDSRTSLGDKRLAYVENLSESLLRPDESHRQKCSGTLRKKSPEKTSSRSTAEIRRASIKQDQGRLRSRSPVLGFVSGPSHRDRKSDEDIHHVARVEMSRTRSSPSGYDPGAEDLRLRLIKIKREKEESKDRKEQLARAESLELKERRAREVSKEIKQRLAREASLERRERRVREESREKKLRRAREESRERKAQQERLTRPAAPESFRGKQMLSVRTLNGKLDRVHCDVTRTTAALPKLYVSAAHPHRSSFLSLWDQASKSVAAVASALHMEIPMPRSESRESSIGIVVDEATNIEPVDMEIDEPNGFPAKIHVPELSAATDSDRQPKVSFSFGGFGSFGKKKEDTVPKKEETASISVWTDSQESNEGDRKPLGKLERHHRKPHVTETKKLPETTRNACETLMEQNTEPVSDLAKENELAGMPGYLIAFPRDEEKPPSGASSVEQKSKRERSHERGKRRESDRRSSKDKGRRHSQDRNRKSSVTFSRRKSPHLVLSAHSNQSPRFSPVRLHGKHRSRSRSVEPQLASHRSAANRRSRSPRRSRTRSPVNRRRSPVTAGRSGSAVQMSRLPSDYSGKSFLQKYHSRTDKGRRSPRPSPRRRSRSPRVRSRSPRYRSRSPPFTLTRRSRSPFDRTQQTLEERERKQELLERRARLTALGRPGSSDLERISVDKENEHVDYECFARGDFRQTRNTNYLVNVAVKVEDVPLPSDAISPVKDEPKSAPSGVKRPAKHPAEQIGPRLTGLVKTEKLCPATENCAAPSCVEWLLDPVVKRLTPAVVPEHEVPFPYVPEPVTGLFPVPFSFTSTGPLFCWPYLLPDSSIVLLPYLGLQKPEDKSKVEHFLVVPKEVNDAADGVPLNFLAIPTYDPTRAVPPPPPAATAPLNQPCKPAIVRLLKMREIEKEKARRQAAKRCMPLGANLETPTPNSATLSSTSVTPLVPLPNDLEALDTPVQNSHFEDIKADFRLDSSS